MARLVEIQCKEQFRHGFHSQPWSLPYIGLALYLLYSFFFFYIKFVFVLFGFVQSVPEAKFYLIGIILTF